jgi:aldehyde:ferredoxin oxidoreductase
MKDSMLVHDHFFPMIMSYESADGLARAGDMLGLDFEYHLYTAATGEDVTPGELEQACERVFNLERALQIRNFGRGRKDDELVIPYFETEEWWENPLLGQKKRLERGEFLALLDRYYRLREWDVERGRPTGAKLRELGLHDVAHDLEHANFIAEHTDNEMEPSPCSRMSGQLL